MIRKPCWDRYLLLLTALVDRPVILLLAGVFLVGCGGRLDQSFFEGSHDLPIKARPYLMFLPGVPGALPSDRERFAALRAGGFDGDIEVFDWTLPYSWFGALQQVDHNRQQARRVAQRLTEIRRAGPDRPISILAVSGGPIIATWALADLPADVKIDRVIMTSPGMSPDFDLSHALAHVSDRCFVVSSVYDVIVSSLFSQLFGGMDRVYDDTAGRWGFRRPPQGDVEQYKKLVNVTYRWSYVIYGNFGTHMGASELPFVENMTAKLLIMP